MCPFPPGVASGLNNAVARAAGLLTVAALPAIVGITGADYRRPSALTDGFHTAAWLTAALALAGGLVAWATIRDDKHVAPAPERHHSHCPLDAPPLRAA